MRTRRGSSVGSSAYRAADTFAVGDVVTPIIVGGKDTFYGVIIDVNGKTNMVMVIWNTGYASQHGPDEVLLAMGVDSVLRERLMGLAAARRKTASRRMRGHAQEVLASNPPMETFSGDPALHGLDTPVSGGTDVMEKLQRKLHEESIKNQGKVSKLHKRRGKCEYESEKLTMRRAVYHRERGRLYKPTRAEQESGVFKCPKCRHELEKESFCRGIKLFSCPECHWKITSDKVACKTERKETASQLVRIAKKLISSGVYQRHIKRILKSMRREDIDPRHVEAWMRLKYGTLDRLGESVFRNETQLAIHKIEDDIIRESERLARSFGL